LGGVLAGDRQAATAHTGAVLHAPELLPIVVAEKKQMKVINEKQSRQIFGGNN